MVFWVGWGMSVWECTYICMCEGVLCSVHALQCADAVPHPSLLVLWPSLHPKPAIDCYLCVHTAKVHTYVHDLGRLAAPDASMHSLLSPPTTLLTTSCHAHDHNVLSTAFEQLHCVPLVHAYEAASFVVSQAYVAITGSWMW